MIPESGGVRAFSDLAEARRFLMSVLLDLAETRLELGQPLPTPNPNVTDRDCRIQIYLLFGFEHAGHDLMKPR